MDEQELRNGLIDLGYDVILVNLDRFYISQGGYVHYLSEYEATELADANLDHPVKLHAYGVLHGKILRYRFNDEKSD